MAMASSWARDCSSKNMREGSSFTPRFRIPPGEIRRVPVPPADGPKLGAIAEVTPILERPAKDAARIGYLHAGEQVARAKEPYASDDCPGGWYPVRPRGFVCAGTTATTDLKHPT